MTLEINSQECKGVSLKVQDIEFEAGSIDSSNFNFEFGKEYSMKCEFQEALKFPYLASDLLAKYFKGIKIDCSILRKMHEGKEKLNKTK